MALNFFFKFFSDCITSIYRRTIIPPIFNWSAIHRKKDLQMCVRMHSTHYMIVFILQLVILRRSVYKEIYGDVFVTYESGNLQCHALQFIFNIIGESSNCKLQYIVYSVLNISSWCCYLLREHPWWSIT